MDDLISRQAALEAVLELDAKHRVSWKDAVIDMLDALPSAQLDYDLSGYSDKLWKAAYERGKEDAQPEQRKMGKWIKKMRVTETEKYTSYDPEWYCPYCGTKYDSHTAKIVNFCYVCGAEMEGG